MKALLYYFCGDAKAIWCLERYLIFIVLRLLISTTRSSTNDELLVREAYFLSESNDPALSDDFDYVRFDCIRHG